MQHCQPCVIVVGMKVNWDRFFSENRAYFRAIAWRILKSDSEVDDALQIAFTKAWRKYDQLREEKLKAWTASIVVNLCYRLAKKTEARHDCGDRRNRGVDRKQSQCRSGSKTVIRKEAIQAISDSIFELPDLQRDLFTLSLYLWL